MSEEQDFENVNLGSKIHLVGFTGLKPGEMTILKKMIGNYFARLEKLSGEVEELKLTMKKIHDHEQKPRAFEVHAQLVAGAKPISTGSENNNLFFAVDKALRALEHTLSK